MMKHSLFRIVADTILLISLFFVPWWLWLILCAVSIAIFDHQYEVLVLAFLADSAYGIPILSNLSGGQYFFLITTTIFLIIAIILKPQIKFYTRFSL